MQNINYIKQVILLVIPFLLGWIVSSSYFFIDVYSNFSLFFSIGMVIFWLWAGSFFSRHYSSKLKGFIIGNSLWGISVALCISQILLTDENAKNGLLFVMGQLYIIFFAPIASKVLSLANVHDGIAVLMASYILMLFVFSFGFYNEVQSDKQ